MTWNLTALFANFNPHPREGGDPADIVAKYGIIISIHTPAKGVTLDAIQVDEETGISIHTPAKGVTGFTGELVKLERISIHTPAKGVTT